MHRAVAAGQFALRQGACRRSSRTRCAPASSATTSCSTNGRASRCPAPSPASPAALFAMAQGGAFVQVMSLQSSGVVVLMTLIGGGFVSFWGPVHRHGALLRRARPARRLRRGTWLLWYGLMFMLVVMFKPEGIAGIWQDVMHRLRPPRAARGRRCSRRCGGSMALFEAHEPAQALRRPRRARGHQPRLRPRASSAASWGRTAPARRPASTC